MCSKLARQLCWPRPQPRPIHAHMHESPAYLCRCRQVQQGITTCVVRIVCVGNCLCDSLISHTQIANSHKVYLVATEYVVHNNLQDQSPAVFFACFQLLYSYWTVATFRQEGSSDSVVKQLPVTPCLSGVLNILRSGCVFSFYLSIIVSLFPKAPFSLHTRNINSF